MGTSSSWQQLPPLCKSSLLCIPTFFYYALPHLNMPDTSQQHSYIILYWLTKVAILFIFKCSCNIHDIQGSYTTTTSSAPIPLQSCPRSCSKMFHSIPQHSTALHSFTQPWKIFYSILQYSTAFHNNAHAFYMALHTPASLSHTPEHTIQLIGHMKASWKPCIII